MVENRPGANGNFGAEIIIKSPPDAYAMLITPPGPLAINASLYAVLSFDPRTAFAPLTIVAVAPLILVAHPSLPATNLKELVDYAKANRGKISAASQGNGSTGYLVLELLTFMAGVDVVHVPYKGSAPAQADLLTGRVQIIFDNITTSLPPARCATGRRRRRAFTPKRSIRSANTG